LLASCATAPKPAAVPQPISQIEVTTLDGRAQRLTDLISGKVAVVSLWATWCEGCAAELDALKKLDRGVRERGGVLIAIAVGEPRDQVARFVASHELPFAQLVDEEFRLADALGQKRVPATLVLDRAGNVVYTGGALDGPALAAVRSALDRS
jgi:peroxiredoxin